MTVAMVPLPTPTASPSTWKSHHGQVLFVSWVASPPSAQVSVSSEFRTVAPWCGLTAHRRSTAPRAGSVLNSSKSALEWTTDGADEEVLLGEIERNRLSEIH